MRFSRSLKLLRYSFVIWGAFTGVALADSLAPSNVVREWNEVALQGISHSKLGAPEAARALAIVHTCIYDAWAAYDPKALATEVRDILRRPAEERTEANKRKTISYAAYRALTDVLPVDTARIYRPAMLKLGYNPDDTSIDINTPQGIANVACGAVLEMRHHDGANQLGDAAQGPYSDWTRYVPVNKPTYIDGQRSSPADVSRWQPLVYFDGNGDLISQRFAAAQ